MTIRRVMAMLSAVVLLLSSGLRAAPRFELCSRSLLEGPARTAAFYKGGVVLGTGGGIVLVPFTETGGEPLYLPVDGQPEQIEIVDSAAYIAANNGGLVVVDLADPAEPRVTFRHRRRMARSCCVSGRFLYLPAFDNKLHIYDLTDPLEPVSVQSVRLSRPILDIGAAGAVIVAVYQNSFEVFRIGGMGVPKSLAVTQTETHTSRALLSGSILYLVTAEGALCRWSLDNPAAARRLHDVPVTGVLDVTVEEERGLILTGTGLILTFKTAAAPGACTDLPEEIEIGDTLRTIGGPAKAPFLDRPFRKGTGPRVSNATAVIRSGDRAATIESWEGLSIYQLEGNTARRTATLPTGGFAVDLVASGGLLFVANSRDGVRIARITDDGTADWIGRAATGHARDLAVSGTYVIVADGESGLKVIDVRNPHEPRIVGERASPYFQSAIVIDEKRAYTAGGLGGAEIYDISDPAHPDLVWREELSEVRGLDIDERHLYLANGYEGLRIYSIEAGEPALRSVFDTPGWNDDAFVIGGIAYIADGGNGIMTVDITDRRAPAGLGAADLGSIVRNIHAHGGTLFAAAHVGGVKAIDVSDPAKPLIAASHPTVDDARGVFADERFVYVASGSGGVYIFRYVQ